MAKNQRGFKATNAMIDEEKMLLVEFTKDGQNVYDLNKIIKEWSGIEGVAFNITLNEEVEPDSTVY